MNGKFYIQVGNGLLIETDIEGDVPYKAVFHGTCSLFIRWRHVLPVLI